VDAQFAFFDNLVMDAYWAKTPVEGAGGNQSSYRGRLDYAGDRYGVQIERMTIGDQFTPEVGFVRQANIRRSYGQFRFSPRPRGSKLVRKYTATGTFDYFENDALKRLDRQIVSGFGSIDFQNTDILSVTYTDTRERLPNPLRLSSDVVVPVDTYDYASTVASYTFGTQRPLASGAVALEYGTFYGGHKTTFSVTRGRSNFPPHPSIEPTYSLNRIDIPQGRFTTHLVGSRVTYTVSPWMFASALIQYNSLTHSVASNVRLRWEYQPGSEFFVVYNDQRGAVGTPLGELFNRAIIVKFNRLFRF
jgi:hypothetical protein